MANVIYFITITTKHKARHQETFKMKRNAKFLIEKFNQFQNQASLRKTKKLVNQITEPLSLHNTTCTHNV